MTNLGKTALMTMGAVIGSATATFGQKPPKNWEQPPETRIENLLQAVNKRADPKSRTDILLIEGAETQPDSCDANGYATSLQNRYDALEKKILYFAKGNHHITLVGDPRNGFEPDDIIQWAKPQSGKETLAVIFAHGLSEQEKATDLSSGNIEKTIECGLYANEYNPALPSTALYGLIADALPNQSLTILNIACEGGGGERGVTQLKPGTTLFLYNPSDRNTYTNAYDIEFAPRRAGARVPMAHEYLWAAALYADGGDNERKDTLTERNHIRLITVQDQPSDTIHYTGPVVQGKLYNWGHRALIAVPRDFAAVSKNLPADDIEKNAFKKSLAKFKSPADCDAIIKLADYVDNADDLDKYPRQARSELGVYYAFRQFYDPGKRQQSVLMYERAHNLIDLSPPPSKQGSKAVGIKP